MNRKNLTHDDKVHLSIERLTGQQIVNVDKEAKMYCYKTFTGEIGTVSIEYVEERVRDGVY